MYEDIRFEVKDDTAWITMNRPEVLNALRWQTGEELRDAFKSADSDSEVRFIVLTGAGRAFCAGDDMKQVWAAEDFEERMKEREFDRYRKPHVVEGDFIIDCEKPVIAAVNGLAVGLGMDFALYCDIRIGADTAKFGWLYVRRGLIGTIAGFYYLPRIVGLSRAYELLLTGRTVEAEEAEKLGLLSKVVPQESLQETVESFLGELRLGTPMAQRAIKRIVRHGLSADPRHLDEYAMQVLDTLFESEDHREALKAYFEKRAPVYRNR